MVRTTGVEPACLAALPPQGSASANFATSAHIDPYYADFFSDVLVSVGLSGAVDSVTGSSAMATAKSFFFSLALCPLAVLK